MKDLIVTLADENYLDQAKQLFSSIYFNAGWQGDYMLLAHEVSEDKLKWFRGKGILIKKCYLDSDKINPGLTPVVLNKFYLFTPEFKKWKTIIYLDADITVNASLDELKGIQRFAAVKSYIKFRKYFFSSFYLIADRKRTGKLKELKQIYDFNSDTFNSGVIVFNSDIIKDSMLEDINKISNKHREICIGGDEPILNLLFYKKWQELPRAYNAYPNYSALNSNLDQGEFKGIVSHFIFKKPWEIENSLKPWQKYFYQEWKNNLNKADSIDLKEFLPAKKKWTKKEIKDFSDFLEKRGKRPLVRLFIFIDRQIGLIGLFLKHNFPGIYYTLKKIKK